MHWNCSPVTCWVSGHMAWRYVVSGATRRRSSAFERAVTMSRTPLFVGLLGLAYARAGRADDTARLLHELEDRSTRGEYVPRRALFHIYVGQGDLPAMRRVLSDALEEGLPPSVFRTTSSPFLEAYRSDPQIDRLLSKLYGQ